MKVLFDANVLLSFLLAPDPNQTVAWVVRTCLAAPDIEVLAPPELIEETVNKAFTKPYFRGKLTRSQVEHFLVQLTAQVQTPHTLAGELARYGRDPDDDYLVAYGLVLDANYLVTGDRDLLVLGQVAQLRIITPAAFRHILKEQGRD